MSWAVSTMEWSPPENAPLSIRHALAGFQTALDEDERVLAAFIGGSFADGTWDEHSDLDLYLVVEDADYDEVFAERRSLIETMGEVVLAEDFDGFGFDMVIFMLVSGVEGELGFGRSSNFSQLHGGPFAALVDREGLLEGKTFDYDRPNKEQRRRSIARTIAWFWRYLSLFATAAQRGRAWTAYGYLEQARHEALDLVWWIEAPDSWPGGFEKLEANVDSGLVDPIRATLVGLGLDEQRTASSALAEFVATQGRAACLSEEIDYPDRLEDTVRSALSLGVGRPSGGRP